MTNNSQACVSSQLREVIGLVALDSQHEQEHTACCGLMGIEAHSLGMKLGTPRDRRERDSIHSLSGRRAQLSAHMNPEESRTLKSRFPEFTGPTTTIFLKYKKRSEYRRGEPWSLAFASQSW